MTAAVAEPASVAVSKGGLKPFKQGELDGFCGLYAGINALRLLFAIERPLKPLEIRKLFGVGISCLSCDNQLACTALAGCNHKVWRKMLKALAAEAERLTDRTIMIGRPFRRRDRPTLEMVFGAIEAAVRERHAALIEMDGRYQHFTVIAGYTPTRLTLWDSGSLYWLTRRSCGVDEEAEEGRHTIKPRSLTVLKLASSQATSA